MSKTATTTCRLKPHAEVKVVEGLNDKWELLWCFARNLLLQQTSENTGNQTYEETLNYTKTHFQWNLADSCYVTLNYLTPKHQPVTPWSDVFWSFVADVVTLLGWERHDAHFSQHDVVSGERLVCWQTRGLLKILKPKKQLGLEILQPSSYSFYFQCSLQLV